MGISKFGISCIVICSLLSLIGSSLVTSAILFGNKSRAKGFNLYLAFLFLPDIIINLFGSISYTIELSIDESLVAKYCKLSVFFNFMYRYYLFANMWTNALVCNEVHQLLAKSRNATRHKSAEPRTVIIRASIVNFFAILNCCILELILPIFSIGMSHETCHGKWSNTSILVSYIDNVTLSMGIPVIYIIYVTVDVYRRKLLPPSGKSRFVATFFLRVAIICTALTLFYGLQFLNPGVFFWIGGFTIHFQGFIVAVSSLMKPDIQKSVLHMLSCGSKEEVDEDAPNGKTEPASNLFPSLNFIQRYFSGCWRSQENTSETEIAKDSSAV